MKYSISTSLCALAVAAAWVGPAAAQSHGQLAASAGISRIEAASLSLDAISAIKFNQAVSLSDRQTVPGSFMAAPAQAGALSLARNAHLAARNMPLLSLSELAALHFNKGVSHPDWQTVRMPAPGPANDRVQLAGSAGLAAGNAQRLSLDALAAHHFNRGISGDERQTVSR
ncbi:hypothetical protein BH23PSE1_BH23PSE1_13490 [soil metagenome]